MIGRRGAVVGGLAALTGGCSPAALLNATVPRTGYTLEADLPYGPLPRQRLDFYAPVAPRADGKTVVFFYGGAWRQGDKADYLFLGQALASRGIGVVVADYRLFPNVRYPAFIQDGALAVGWSARRFGSERLFLMGHSAGAYIASMLADQHRLPASRRGRPPEARRPDRHRRPLRLSTAQLPLAARHLRRCRQCGDPADHPCHGAAAAGAAAARCRRPPGGAAQQRTAGRGLAGRPRTCRAQAL